MSNDLELWDRICRKDEAAFDLLYRNHASVLRAYLRHALGNSQAAEDVTQETFASIWQRPNGFDPERGTLRAYLFGAGRKHAFEWWRKRRPESETPEQYCESAETQSVIGDAFGRLPAEQRSLLWLREVEGQSYEELAAIMKVPLGTVRSRLFAAREALRKIWHSKPIAEGEQ